MQIKNSLIYGSFILFTLTQCAPWETWTADKANNEAYKSAGYGKKSRYYTGQNIRAISNSLKSRANSRKLISKSSLMLINERLAFSQAIDDYRTKARSENYLNNYDNVLNAEISEDADSNSKGSSKPYFDLAEYNKKHPTENIKKIKGLRKYGLIPMPPKTAEIIERYYQNYFPSEAKKSHTKNNTDTAYQYNKRDGDYD